jgi:arsenical pump membrane protein
LAVVCGTRASEELSRWEEVGLSGAAAEIISVGLLIVVLGAAVVRPWGWPEATIAVPAAILVIAIGAISPHRALTQATRLGPVIGFLAAVLVLAQLCQDEGLFRAIGAWLARDHGHGRGQGRTAVRLLARVFVVASVVTAVLGLDATVVLLTPVVFAAAARLGARAKPHVYGSCHLANSASLLLPVSNLTNLLAFAASGLSFTRFAGLMALPWLVAIAVEYAVFRWFFRADLSATQAASPAPSEPVVVPVLVIVVLAVTLAGFAAASLAGINPAWAAAAGAAVLAIRALARKDIRPTAIWRAADVPFLAFVLALGVVVAAVTENGLAGVLQRVIPGGTSLPALLGTAALAAAAANVINNLPAVLVLLPLAARPAGAAAILAVLVGVNIGPNLTYAGSLATLLWRRVLREHDAEPDVGEFTRLGLLTVPAGIILATVALWVSLRVI